MERTRGQQHLTVVRHWLPLSSWVCFGPVGSLVPVSGHPAPSLQTEQYMVFLEKKPLVCSDGK